MSKKPPKASDELARESAPAAPAKTEVTPLPVITGTGAITFADDAASKPPDIRPPDPTIVAAILADPDAPVPTKSEADAARLSAEDVAALGTLLERGAKIADELGGLPPEPPAPTPDLAEVEKAQLDALAREPAPSETKYYMVMEHCRYIKDGTVSTWPKGMVIDSLNFNIDDVRAQGLPIMRCDKDDADLSPPIGQWFA